MARILILLMSLIVTPVLAAELGDSFVKLFQVQAKLAQGGNAGALYSLGQMHEQGLGTQVDLDQAYKWYKKAASKGDRRAKHKMARRSSAISDEERMIKAMTAITSSVKARAHEQEVNRALMAKKRARAKALLQKQRELALTNDMEDL